MLHKHVEVMVSGWRISDYKLEDSVVGRNNVPSAKIHTLACVLSEVDLMGASWSSCSSCSSCSSEFIGLIRAARPTGGDQTILRLSMAESRLPLP